MKVSVVQLSPGSDKSHNISHAETYVGRVVRQDHPDLVVLPEVWTCLGGTTEQKFAAAEDIPSVGSTDGGGDAIAAVRRMAREHGIFVHAGSMAERGGDRLLNTSVVISPDGTLLARYSKMHLFDIMTPSGLGYRESDTYRAGEEVVSVSIEGRFGRIRLGLAICYDIRFGELFRKLREQGADLIVLPAAFTVETGSAHWETLVRARAIETQCWVAAAGTVGAHQDADGGTRYTFGHSMIVDPWGAIVAQASSGPGVASAFVDAALTQRIRSAIPVAEHRRLR
ncbi:carbon-nitrogen hydrolase family protein [Acetobacteraceae bacterium KSS8]|uniref:Carbon-nitrogen hydrolase family protein n=1 Tax=Endosaccharibacter trunci TaxID=2812733 RepID=A0ABT1WAL4_9PROT|nr:carbon-nitrogen hydrolase family protein [Acetobacteraceae bacterium KSS8]